MFRRTERRVLPADDFMSMVFFAAIPQNSEIKKRHLLFIGMNAKQSTEDFKKLYVIIRPYILLMPFVCFLCPVCRIRFSAFHCEMAKVTAFADAIRYAPACVNQLVCLIVQSRHFHSKHTLLQLRQKSCFLISVVVFGFSCYRKSEHYLTGGDFGV